MMKLKVSNVLAVPALALLTFGCGDSMDGPAVTSRPSASGMPAAVNAQVPVDGWLSWRGPSQAGTSTETGLPESVSVDGENGSWSYKLAGRGTPVIAGNRVYTLGYEGAGTELQELLVCLDATNGQQIWEHRFTDFLTDVIYHRFSISSPTIDPETGNVLCMSSAGLLSCFTAEGALLWQHSMMSEYGRLTFPNGRTGAPLVDGELVVVHVISASWGPHGPARDRFYAFDKDTGESLWSCTPGGPPKDSSFSFPVVAEENGKRVLYAGLGGGHVVCVDLRTGDPLWKFQMATGGVNSSALLYKDTLIAIHGKENLDISTIGRMVSIKRGSEPGPGEPQLTLGTDHEVWRTDLTAFTSSPVLVGNRIYQTDLTGELHCIDADTGEEIWHEKLAPDQLHASPAWGDGKLYIPMNNGQFYVVRPSEEGPEILQTVQLAGNCLGAPAIYGGKIYVHTTDRLYCMTGTAETTATTPPTPMVSPPAETAGSATRLQIVPADFLAVQGQNFNIRARSLDAAGRVVADSVEGVTWSGLPAGVTIDGGVLNVAADASPTATNISAAVGGLTGSARSRIVPSVPFAYDFESGARPPAHWIGVGPKWELSELGGDKVFAKRIDNPLFQRAMGLTGHPDMSNYTVQVDVYTDGNRRIKGTLGMVNQRYLILLKGNHQTLEVSSNMELLKVETPFSWKIKTWYRMKSRVDIQDDGSSIVRAKVWQRDAPEPEDWTIEVPHPNGHTHGSPGFLGLTPQSRFRVYLDNYSVIAND